MGPQVVQAAFPPSSVAMRVNSARLCIRLPEVNTSGCVYGLFEADESGQDGDGLDFDEEVWFSECRDSEQGDGADDIESQSLCSADGSFAELRHRAGFIVNDVDGQIRDVVERPTCRGDGCVQIDVDLLSLSGEISVADGPALSVVCDDEVMRIERVVPNLTVSDLPTAVREHSAVLGLRVVMDHGWIITLGDDESHQLSLMTQDATAKVNPDVSIFVDDVREALDRVRKADLDVVHPLTDEPWGVTRFFYRSSDGRVVNVGMHTTVA